jgi:asparagine synthase (glutamine-hydrolysing)
MCGIVGIASSKAQSERGWLAAGRDAMRHRGPDDFGEWWSPDGRVGMGHRRLAIIDLTAGGHQPMHDAAGSLVTVFNGEIYNFMEVRKDLQARGHLFRSDSDTEVILAAYREWGTECLTRLNGMFAFAIYDRNQGVLFLARDRAGEKPLFYTLTGGALRFGSELKALLADPSLPRRIDVQALECYLALGFVPGELSILHGIKKLPPAHALIFALDSGAARLWRYWVLPDLEPSAVRVTDEPALVEELESLLADAVRRQLVADVPVGVLLSGGVDSSLVTALAMRAAPNVKTFTIRFAGHAQYDETEHARMIARHFGTEHVELDAPESSHDLLPVLARQFDEPVVDSSMIPTYLVSRLVRRHCTVALGGDGGDELFGGYGHYNRLLWLQKRAGPIPRMLRRPVSIVAGAVLPVGFRGRNWLQAFGEDMGSGVPLIASYFDRKSRQRLVGRSVDDTAFAETLRQQRMPRGTDLLQRATRMDFENYLPEDILVKVDRASMLNSLEIRAPLLDRRVVEFAFAKVPSHLKATATARKILLKKLASRILPSEFDQRRKQGFSIPLASWLQKGPWRTFFREVLLDGASPLFDRGAVKDLLDGQARGRSNSERLFGLVMFELWRREYRVSL